MFGSSLGSEVGGNQAQAMCDTREADAWLSCLYNRRSVWPELPLGSFHFPQSGWLVVAEFGLLRAPCPTYFAVSLATGESHWVRDCEVLRGWGSVDRGRELAIALLGEQAREVTRWQRVRVPEGVDVAGTCSLSSAPPPVRVRRWGHGRVAYWWWDGERVVAAGLYEIGTDDDVVGGFVQQLLRGSQASLTEGATPTFAVGRADDEALNAAIDALERGATSPAN